MAVATIATRRPVRKYTRSSLRHSAERAGDWLHLITSICRFARDYASPTAPGTTRASPDCRHLRGFARPGGKTALATHRHPHLVTARRPPRASSLARLSAPLFSRIIARSRCGGVRDGTAVLGGLWRGFDVLRRTQGLRDAANLAPAEVGPLRVFQIDHEDEYGLVERSLQTKRSRRVGTKNRWKASNASMR